MLIALTRQHNIIQTGASAKWLVKQIRKALILPLKKKKKEAIAVRQTECGWELADSTIQSHVKNGLLQTVPSSI